MAFESPDGMSSTEGVGFLSQMGNSFKSILTGVVLLPVSFVIIYNVETCEQASAALKNAVPVGQAKDNQPSYVTGILKANPLGGRFVKSGPYISYSVSSEVYAWDEEVKTEGSGSNKKEVRNCVLKWTSSPENPSNFKLSGCRTKPYHRQSVKDQSDSASGAVIFSEGKNYSVNLEEVDFTSQVSSRDANENEILSNGFVYGEGYLYSSKACVESEKEGCERVQVSVTPIPEKDMTFIGDIKGNRVAHFTSAEGNKFLNASVGDFAETIADIKSDDNTMKWVGRFIGFIAMFSSFTLMAGPLTSLLSFIPFVGDLGGGLIKVVLGIVAFIITAITILLIKFWYIWLVLLLGGIGYAIYKRKYAPQKAI
ncbi:TMEM43 family protein [Leptospira borgpetersenii]|uniref:TMEM43 family protein n=1 Tax=Leptospira borgpetersenii TaxID=174 RepID=UPI0007735FB8|nr:TMEM43 family protein [Leptospira borgpetersenii]MBE8364111.1 TMEM43 family protein [Leptospira borgpetersenii serovar Balcanica]MBE8369164.1 TMEM43 family protein [Leptospira borgpetersenii serovar Balcanica]MBE8423256.1 TMEM43 family protein [Leptospira borgpetersenii serovar Balcanica]MBF3350312.1 TMEM43 family protein [Leptospira borgpetersenii serovar Balcanica]